MPLPSEYVGRFAPSPTGPLHAGSLVAALASYLDARAHGGRWLLRIEDLDPPREVRGASVQIIGQLHRLGFRHDGPVVHQSDRDALYQRAFDRLTQRGLVYPCACTRREVTLALARAGRSEARHQEAVYPGTCRHGLPPGRRARAWRLRCDDVHIHWRDRNGAQHDDALATQAGDFVLRRSDGLWAYQLAVVVDDAEQHVTDVVRGADLIDSTSRQIHLQRLLGYPTPRYLHVPLVLDARGEKLSKQTQAAPIDERDPIHALQDALMHLGLPAVAARTLDEFWPEATRAWAQRMAP